MNVYVVGNNLRNPKGTWLCVTVLEDVLKSSILKLFNYDNLLINRAGEHSLSLLPNGRLLVFSKQDAFIQLADVVT